MENKFIRAEEVAQELSVSKPYAYKLIRQLNEELKAKGFITITGRVHQKPPQQTQNRFSFRPLCTISQWIRFRH